MVAAIIVAVLVVVAVVVAIVVVVLQKNSKGNDFAALKSTFPQLVKPSGVGSSGTGYDGQSCFRETDGKTLRTPGDAADFRVGSWTAAWDCWGAVDKPEYAVLSYDSSSDAQRVIAGLPANRKGAGVTGSDVKYDSYMWKTADSAIPNEFWKVIAFRDSTRSRYLIVAHGQYWPGLQEGKTYQEFDTWCNKMPMA